mgnify:CR=1 FL=1
MGHNASKDLWRRAAKKIDNLHARCPDGPLLRELLARLYTVEEAELFVALPYVFSDLERIARLSGVEPTALRCRLERMCEKGLVIDIFADGRYFYMPSPMVIGVFEISMMRSAPDAELTQLAALFSAYLSGEFYAANVHQTSWARALPHEQAIDETEHAQILDYERASELVRSAEHHALGICSCRHEKHHLGRRACETPLGVCASLGWCAEYMIRHGAARQVSAEELLQTLDRSREQGLVFCADNVQQRATFICQCCGCCCNLLRGISHYGYAQTVVTSNYIAENDRQLCSGCGQCIEACPIDAIELEIFRNEKGKKRGRARVDRTLCLGCGVCALRCEKESMRLVPREQRVLHPETTFERLILMSLQRGTLQNQLFDDPTSLTQEFMRGVLGAFLRLSPVKRALMSDALRSRFLAASRTAIKLSARPWLAEI